MAAISTGNGILDTPPAHRVERPLRHGAAARLGLAQRQACGEHHEPCGSARAKRNRAWMLARRFERVVGGHFSS